MFYSNHPPQSAEFKKQRSSKGYGVFQSASIENTIKIPQENETLLVLNETDDFVLTTNLIFLQRWLEQKIEKASYNKKSYIFLLKKVIDKDIHFIEGFLKDLTLTNVVIHKQIPQLPFSIKLRNFFIKKRTHFDDSVNNNQEYSFALKAFLEIIIRQSAFYIWDKQLQEYATSIEHYEVVNHPAPAIGDATDYYVYQKFEIAKYLRAQY